MNHGIETAFDSIESAHEFVGLLTEAVVEAKRDIEADVQRESGSRFPRRLEALRLALYNVEKLEFHMNKSRLILNDLRSLRRLLFEERTSGDSRANVDPQIAHEVITERVRDSIVKKREEHRDSEGSSATEWQCKGVSDPRTTMPCAVPAPPMTPFLALGTSPSYNLPTEDARLCHARGRPCFCTNAEGSDV